MADDCSQSQPRFALGSANGRNRRIFVVAAPQRRSPNRAQPLPLSLGARNRSLYPIVAIHGLTKRRPAISRSGSNLIEAVPHRNFPGGHSQKLRQHHKLASVRCPDAKENPGRGRCRGSERATAHRWARLELQEQSASVSPATSLSRDDGEAKRGPRRFLGRHGLLSHYGLTPAFSGHVSRVFLTQPEPLSHSIARRWIIRRRSWIDGRRLQVVQLLLVQLPGDVTA